jgi:pimeloyl-ACP methyl ester carboxylesterase
MWLVVNRTNLTARGVGLVAGRIRRTPDQRLTRVAAATVATMLVAAGISGPAAASSTLPWGPCIDSTLAVAGFECARLDVPVDPNQPEAAQFSLALTRHRSTGSTSERIGSLLYNPGGAFGSGLDAARRQWPALSTNVQRRFDLVSWDPRGFGATTPALTACSVAPFRPPATGPVDWTAQAAAYEPVVAAANADCYARNAAIAAHMSTTDVTRDLEAIRVALAEGQLTFYGASNGTMIGYDYATTYPDKVRAMILDASINPLGSIAGLSAYSIAGDDAWKVFTAARPRAARQFAASLAALNRKPLRLTPTQIFTRWDLIGGALGATADEQGYDQLAAAIGYVHLALTGAPAKRDAAKHVLLQDWTPAAEGWAAGQSSLVECSDFTDRPSPAEQAALIEQAQGAAPIAGPFLQTQVGLICGGIPPPTPTPLRAPEQSSLPVLIIGATHDAVAPYPLTTGMKAHFPNARLIAYASRQHVTWTGRSACVNNAADRYLITASLPTHDLSCPTTHP